MTLTDILAAARINDGGLTATIPDDWLQGRTSYGGLSAALALAAAQGLAPDLPPLRSAQIAFVGPLAGEVDVRARLLRRGRNATWVGVEVTSAAGVGLTATFVFMGPVAGSALALHAVPPPAGLIAIEAAPPLPSRAGPSFGVHFERRFALKRDSEPQPQVCWWVRLAARSGLEPMVELLCCGDALPPGVMPLTGAVALSSMTWQINLLTPRPQTRDGWWLLRAVGNYAEAGCSSQQMEIWNTEGEAVATAMQSIAIFG